MERNTRRGETWIITEYFIRSQYSLKSLIILIGKNARAMATMMTTKIINRELIGFFRSRPPRVG